MGTVNSSKETQDRATRLSRRISAYHYNITIDETVSAHETMVQKALNFEAKYKVEGGTDAENLAKQNIQARNRMVIAYELAQLTTSAPDRKHPRPGVSLLVLGSGNVDENLRGYFTKYVGQTNPHGIHACTRPS